MVKDFDLIEEVIVRIENDNALLNRANDEDRLLAELKVHLQLIYQLKADIAEVCGSKSTRKIDH